MLKIINIVIYIFYKMRKRVHPHWVKPWDTLIQIKGGLSLAFSLHTPQSQGAKTTKLLNMKKNMQSLR